MYYVTLLVPAWRVTKLLEMTKASMEHSAAFTEDVLKEVRKDWGISCLPVELTMNLTPLE